MFCAVAKTENRNKNTDRANPDFCSTGVDFQYSAKIMITQARPALTKYYFLIKTHPSFIFKALNFNKIKKAGLAGFLQIIFSLLKGCYNVKIHQKLVINSFVTYIGKE